MRQFRIILPTIALVLLISCGFQPLMRDRANGELSEEFSRIQILPIPDRSGQILRNYLLDDLIPNGTSGPTLYTLEVKLQEPRQEIAIRRDESASRVSYAANATFTLSDSAGRQLVGGGSTVSSTYEVTNSEFASIAGQRVARDRAIQQISADIRQQLAAYFGRGATAQGRRRAASP